MRRIFHLLDEQEVFSDHAGGAISRWAANMLRNGPEIIVCPSYDSSWGFPAERLYVLPKWSWTDPVHPLLYRLPWFLQRPIYLAVFAPLLEKLRPGDILYVHNRPECAAVLATVARQRGFTLMLHMHNSHLIRANRHQKAALRNTPIVFVSEYLRAECQAAWPDHQAPTCVVYNGADDTIFHSGAPRRQSPPEIIFTGRLIPIKGVHILVEAMRLLESRGVQARCTIVGGSGFGNRRKTFYVRKLEAGKCANTTLAGYRTGSAVAELLRDADIYCLPSVWKDPFPLSVLEALATGMPVVASNTGGIPEELAWGGGLMVEPNNPKLLADALESLIQNPGMRERMGAEALVVFKEHFLWSTVRKQYESFLAQLGFSASEQQAAPGKMASQ